MAQSRTGKEITKFRKVVFICMDNTCCSIMAEAIMRGLLTGKEETASFVVASRGLVVLFPEPLNPKVLEVLHENQLYASKRATQELSLGDIGGDTLLLTMTDQEKRMAQERFPTALNLYTLREFVGETGDIREPYGGSIQEYASMYEHLDLMVKMAAQRMRSQT